MSNCTNNFIKRVIGVTRTFQWTITTNGAAVPLVADDLTLHLVPPRGEAVSLPFDVDDNVVSFTWQGDDQHIIGCYSLILWANYGEENQRRVDIHNFLELIPWSDRQSGEYSDLVEETIELDTADFGENIMVVDNLNSTSATDALSANMGRQLNVTKQDVISDLATIRSGAAAGAAVKEWAKNDPLITDDATQASASRLSFNGNVFEQWVPGTASSIGLKGIAGFLKLADISQWDSAYNDRMLPTVAAVKAKLQAVLTALGTIEAVIPSQASSTNKLTDKDYVDGAIATNTANFVGTFDTLAELQAVQNPTKNDYGFVIEQDAQGNEYYDRYKYTGTQWLYEYKVESTPFTTEQWAAIQSGITAALVSKLSALPTNAELNTALASKQPVIDDLTTIRSGAAAGATAYQKPSGGIPKTDLAAAVQTSLGKADSAYQKPSSGIPASDLASAVQTSLGKADAAAPQSTTYTKSEVDAALALKQTSSQIATINGSDITHGGNVTIVAAEGQTITIDAAPTEGSSNAVSSGGVYSALYGGTAYETIDLSTLTTYQRTINAQTNKWSSQTNGKVGVFFPVNPGQSVKITKGTISSYYAVLRDDTHGSESSPHYATGYTARVMVTDNAEFVVPVDGHYIWVMYTVTAGTCNDIYQKGMATEGINDRIDALEDETEDLQTQIDILEATVVPQYDEDAPLNAVNSFGNTLRKLSYDLDSNGYQKPETFQALNVIRKAKQATSIEWTPKASIPYNTGSFAPNTPVTGLPYSSVKELDKFIGYDVSIHTFMTAVNNPYSLLYTENVSASSSASAWGKTYNGVNCACYYGTVCTTFTGMCVGYQINYDSEECKWLAEKAFRAVRLYNQSAQGLEVGDIYWKQGHCRLIVGLKRNTSGEVTDVQVAESIGSHCRQNERITAAAFDNTLKNESGIIYRPLEFYKNIDYTPSPYVAVLDETPQVVAYNNDICCFAGDKATFREGDTIAVNYNLQSVGAWTEMELYKDDVLVDTIIIDSSVHVVDLTSFNLAFGQYKARMKDGSNYSEFTYWEVLKTDVTATVTGGVAHITWVSSGKAVQAKVCIANGTNRGHRELTPSEIAANEAYVNFVRLNEEQDDGQISGQTGVYLKVTFQGDYGRVTNIPLSIVF